MNGTIADVFGVFPDLTTLQMQQNPYLTGPLPTSLTSLPHLSTISFVNNALSGRIPSSYGNFMALDNLFL